MCSSAEFLLAVTTSGLVHTHKKGGLEVLLKADQLGRLVVVDVYPGKYGENTWVDSGYYRELDQHREVVD